MIWTQAIKALLAAESDVTDLVATRIYPMHAPLNATLPFITYEVTGNNIEHTKEEAACNKARVEVVGYANTYADACTLVSKMNEALARKSYNSGCIVVDKIFIVEEEIEFLEHPDRYAVVLDIIAFVPL